MSKDIIEIIYIISTLTAELGLAILTSKIKEYIKFSMIIGGTISSIITMILLEF